MKLRLMSLYRSPASTIHTVALVPDVQHALMKWVALKLSREKSGVLIGGLAMSFYTKPRCTEDVNLLFLHKYDIPNEVAGFKKRVAAFQENKTHVLVEVHSPESINLPQDVASKVFATAVEYNGLKVASAQAMVVLKLYGSDTKRRELRCLADIEAILENSPKLSLSGWEHLVKKSHLEKFKDCKSRMTF